MNGLGDFAGTGTLVRLGLRRDRILIPTWIVVFVISAAGSAKASIDLYSDHNALVEAARTTNASPALVSLYGRIFDESSLGEVSLFKFTACGVPVVQVPRVRGAAGRFAGRDPGGPPHPDRGGVRAARVAERRRTRSV